MKKLLRWVAVFILGTSFPTHAALLVFTSAPPAGHVVNGSFEKGKNPGVSANLTAPDATTIRGWTLENGTVDYIGNRWTAGEGKRSLDLTGLSAGTIFQNVSGLKVGKRYRLSFLMAANTEDGGGVKTLQASIGDDVEVFSFDGAGFDNENMGWSPRTLDFVAHSTVLRLTFISLDEGLYGPALDNVRITRVPRPRASVSPGHTPKR